MGCAHCLSSVYCLIKACECSLSVTNTDIAQIIVAAVNRHEMVKAVIDSARRRGVWPLNKLVVAEWIAKEKTTKTELPSVKMTTQLVLRKLKQDDRKTEEHEAARKREKKTKKLRETDTARDLSKEDALAKCYLHEQNQDVKSVRSVEDLRATLLKPPMSFQLADLQPNGKWKTREELLAMAKAFYEDQQKSVQQRISDILGSVPPSQNDQLIAPSTTEAAAAMPAAPSVVSAKDIFERLQAEGKALQDIDIATLESLEDLNIVIDAVGPAISKLDRLRAQSHWRTLHLALVTSKAGKRKSTPKTAAPPPQLQTLPPHPITVVATAAEAQTAMRQTAATPTSTSPSQKRALPATVSGGAPTETQKRPVEPALDEEHSAPTKRSKPVHHHNLGPRRK